MGAVNKEDSGLYFSWGNTEGHAEGSGYDFSQDEYNKTPASAITTNLSLSQDAARANLGAAWRMPTDAEFKELVDNCTHVWTTRNGIAGILFTSNVNGNSIFFPAAGIYDNTHINGKGTRGIFWSSSYNSAEIAYCLLINNSDVSPQYSTNRHYGFTVRAVLNL